jgi:hypothetical protein
MALAPCGRAIDMETPPVKGEEEGPAQGRVTRPVPPVRVFSQLGVRLPADLARRLRIFSARSGQSLNAIVSRALERYLQQEGDEDGTGPRA